ncbi:hypothetical protein [Anaerosporobacter sp.]|uniref:hypothetical protein n=1 Tax=Anaerosporobacter sp. TaxID=1872529 RepID=UPI00289CDD69|nr:hypothetical protein [Anaerosporobacter sp.]
MNDNLSQYINLDGFVKRDKSIRIIIPTRFIVEYEAIQSQGKGIVQELLEKYQLEK